MQVPRVFAQRFFYFAIQAMQELKEQMQEQMKQNQMSEQSFLQLIFLKESRAYRAFFSKEEQKEMKQYLRKQNEFSKGKFVKHVVNTLDLIHWAEFVSVSDVGVNSNE